MSDRDNAADVAIGLDAFSDDDRRELETLARLPDWEPRQPCEPLDSYGQRALEFLLAFLCVESMSIEDLEQADRAALIAVVARGISPIALERLSTCRRRIARLLIERRASESLHQGEPIKSHHYTPTDNRDDDGSNFARLIDRPFSRPPSGQKVEVEF